MELSDATLLRLFSPRGVLAVELAADELRSRDLSRSSPLPCLMNFARFSSNCFILIWPCSPSSGAFGAAEDAAARSRGVVGMLGSDVLLSSPEPGVSRRLPPAEPSVPRLVADELLCRCPPGIPFEQGRLPLLVAISGSTASAPPRLLSRATWSVFAAIV